MRLVTDYARVRVPASAVLCSNDHGEHLTVAFDLWDDYAATVTVAESRTMVTGPSKEVAPRNADHPTIKAMLATLDHIQAPQAGIALIGQTQIPPAVGLGARSAAIVAGINLVRALVGDPADFTDDDACDLAISLGASPWRVHAIISGGTSLGWSSGQSQGRLILPLSSALPVTLLVSEPRSTADSNYASGAVAVLAHALSQDPQILPQACQLIPARSTQDPASAYSGYFLQALHNGQWPAVLAGSGPAIVLLTDLDPQLVQRFSQEGYASISTSLIGKVSNG